MKLGNLQRAAELAADIPALREARTILSQEGASLMASRGGERAVLPRELHANVIAVINATINRLEEEAKTL